MAALSVSPGAHSSPPTLLDFVSTVPAPLTTVLVGLSPWIARVRYGAELVSWRTTWDQSWLLVFGWWGVCLLSIPIIRYLLPLALCTVVALRRWRPRHETVAPVASEQTLQAIVADLAAIYAYIPSPSPTPSTTQPTPLSKSFRAALILSLPWLVLTYFVRLRVLVGISGTIVLTWRAPWAHRLRHTLWRSAYLRWTCYKLWSLLSGEPLPPHILSPQTRSLSALSQGGPQKKEGDSVRFLFTVYENQRWWMGLDWTAALLPGERPSWCSAPPALAPVTPPAAFSLPAPTTVYMPLPFPSSSSFSSGKGKGKGKGKENQAGGPRKRLKRTAFWTWEEPEWRLCVKTDPAAGRTARVERHPPDESMSPTAPGSAGKTALARAASKVSAGWASGHIRSASADKDVPLGEIKEKEKEDAEREAREKEGQGHKDGSGDMDGEDPVTDPDGWVYGDNKWEGASPKGGLGKYTRYRRWTRIAVLREEIEVVDDEVSSRAPALAPQKPQAPPSPTRLLTQLATSNPSALAGSSAVTASPTTATAGQGENVTVIPSPKDKEGENDSASRLRQRLKAAVKNAGT